MITNTGRVPNASSSGPAATSPIGPASIAIVNTAVISFGRSASGVRVVISPITGALTSGCGMVETNRAAIVAQSGRSSPSSQIGTDSATIPNAASFSGLNRGINFIARTMPSSAPAPREANSAPATRELSPKLVEREHRQRRRHHRAEHVQEDGGETDPPEQRVAEQEAEAREEAAGVVGLRLRRARRDEERQRQEGEEEGRGVDVEHARGADGRDQQAGDDRSEQVRQRRRTLDHRVRLRHGRLVLADELRQDHALRGEERRQEAADRKDDREQERKAEQPRRVQEGDRAHQRHTSEIRELHRAARPEPGDDRSARDPEQRDRRQLDRENDPHLRRGARCDQHEPRQGEEGDPRAHR